MVLYCVNTALLLVLPMNYDDADIARRYNSARQLPEATLVFWLDKISEHIPADEVHTIVDVGCGTGRFSAALANTFEADVIGFDPSITMLKEATSNVSHRRVQFLVGDSEHISLTGSSADLVYLSMVYHHIPDPDSAAREFKRVLRPGGFVCIRNSTLDLLDQVSYLKYFPSAMKYNSHRIPLQRDVINTLQTNGFTLLKHEVVQHQFAATQREYYEKIKLRGLSDLVLLSDVEFEAGLIRMKADIDSNQVSEPVFEPIDLFVFRVESR